jgi:hypothetical protein
MSDTGYIPNDPSDWTRVNVADLEHWVERNAPPNVRLGLLGLLGSLDTTAGSKFSAILHAIGDEASAIEVALEALTERLPPMLAWEAEDIMLRRQPKKTKATNAAIAKHKEKKPNADEPGDLAKLARQELPFALGGARLALAELNRIVNENEGAL